MTKVWYDCDNCGPYRTDYGHVTIDGKQIVHAESDGHFGAGNWEGGLYELFAWALEALGYVVQLKEGTPIGSPYTEVNHDKGYRENLPVPLFSGTTIPLVLQYETPADVDEDWPTRVVVPALPGHAHTKELVFDAKSGWEPGDYGTLLQAVLQSICVLEVDEFEPGT